MNIRTPIASIQVIAVLRNASQIHDAEVRASRGPAIRSWFSQIIKTSPHKLACDESVVLQQLEFVIGYVGPRRGAEIVGTDIFAASRILRFAVRQRECVIPASGNRRGGFAVKDRVVRIGVMVASVTPSVIPARQIKRVINRLIN